MDRVIVRRLSQAERGRLYLLEKGGNVTRRCKPLLKKSFSHSSLKIRILWILVMIQPVKNILSLHKLVIGPLLNNGTIIHNHDTVIKPGKIKPMDN